MAEQMHFWHSLEMAENLLSYDCKQLGTCKVEGYEHEVEYTASHDKKIHGTRYDDIVYLGVGTVVSDAILTEGRIKEMHESFRRFRCNVIDFNERKKDDHCVINYNEIRKIINKG